MDEEKILYSQFNNFPRVFIDKYFPKLSLGNPEILEDIEKRISDYFRPTLIYIINEKRIEGALVGETSEERYDYFNNILCKEGEVLREIERRFPEISHRVIVSLQKYLNLVESVKAKFTEDFIELIRQGYINSECLTPNLEDVRLKVTGDIHNGNGVCIISYQEQKVVFKKKSTRPNLLLKSLDNRISSYLGKEIQFIPEFLDKKEYFWEKFVYSKPLHSKHEAEEFYRKVGYLLACSYILNISDLHFENLISSNATPTLVDVETIFSTTPFGTIAKNKATKQIVEKSRNSVLSTGLLPIAEADKIFGGDTSGVLGGTLVGEAKVVVNHNRDDIHVEKKKYQIENQDHLPYFLNGNGERVYLNAVEYVDFIKEGFAEISQFFVSDKEYIEKLYLRFSDIQTRILFRNTRDYSLIRQLLLSPVYCNKSQLLFEKMANKLSEYDSHLLLRSEEKQLLNMDIPYFYTSISSKEIKDDTTVVWNLPSSSLELVIDKLRNLNDKSIKEQIDLIEFSIKTPQALYSTELQEEYQEYEDVKEENHVLLDGVNSLVDIILNDERYSPEDNSTNWLTLKVTDYDVFELVPMDDSIYEGIAGVAIALSEVFEIVDSVRQERIRSCLKRIFFSLVEVYDKLQNKSYYVGQLGLVSAMLKICSLTGQQLPENILFDKSSYSVNVNTPKVDFLSSFPNEIVALRNTDITIKNLSTSLKKFEELCIYDSDYISWDRLESNNVSLAHGNLGVEIALLLLAGQLRRPEALELFNQARNFDNEQRLDKGWLDKRNGKTSANWCHGSTGVLVARLAQLQIDDRYKVLSHSERRELEKDIEHAVAQIIEIGFDMTNFSLCHGTSGNLLALSYYMNYMGNNECPKIKIILDREYKKLHSFGLEKGWMCSFNTKYNVYGLMTGIPGILFSTAKYLKGDRSLDILVPVL